MKWRIRGIVACLVVVVCAPGAFGQDQQSNTDFQLNLFAGPSFFSDKSFEVGPPQSPTPIPLNFEIDRRTRGGFRLNFLTTDRWGLEFFSSYESTVAGLARADGAVPELRFPIQHYTFGVDYIYYPLGSAGRGRWVPFVLGGGGAAIYRPTSEGKRIASDPLAGNLPDLLESGRMLGNYGAGFKYRLTNIFGFRADIQGGITRSPTFGLNTASDDPTETVLPLTGYSHNTEISVGFTIKLWSGR